MDIKIKKLLKVTGRWRRAAAAGALACAMCISSICAQGAENPADMRVTEGQDESNAGNEILEKLISYEYGDPYDGLDPGNYEHYDNVYIQDKVIYQYYEKTDDFIAQSVDRYHYSGGGDIVVAPYVLGKPVVGVGVNLTDQEEGLFSFRSLALPETLQSLHMHDVRADYVKLADGFKGDLDINECMISRIDLPRNLTEIGRICESSVEKVVLPKKLETITDFSGCIDLASMFLPSSVRKINAKAFQGCTRLNLFVPASVKVIGKGAFGTNASDRIEMLYCTDGSRAQKYAQKNHIPYTVVGGKGSISKVTKISVPKKKIVLDNVRDDAYIDASTLPAYLAGEDLIYTSNKPEEVSVGAMGRVRALRNGTSAKITVRSASNGKLKKTVKVIVRGKKDPFTLTLNGKSVKINLLNNISAKGLEDVATFQIEYRAPGTPEAPEYEVLLQTGEKSASIENAKPGTYYIAMKDSEGYVIASAIEYEYNP